MYGVEHWLTVLTAKGHVPIRPGRPTLTRRLRREILGSKTCLSLSLSIIAFDEDWLASYCQLLQYGYWSTLADPRGVGETWSLRSQMLSPEIINDMAWKSYIMQILWLRVWSSVCVGVGGTMPSSEINGWRCVGDMLLGICPGECHRFNIMCSKVRICETSRRRIFRYFLSLGWRFGDQKTATMQRQFRFELISKMLRFEFVKPCV